MKYFVAFCTILLAMFSFSASSQTVQPTDPMVFLWAEDKEKAAGDDWRALGSGFLVGTDGVILTARHVVERRRPGERIVVSVSSKSHFPIRIDDTDITCAAVSQDICAVRIPKNSIPPTLTTKYDLRCRLPELGVPLRALGFVGGADRFGGINQPKGEVIGDITKGRLVPTDIGLVPTMSGGPVFDTDNKVIAMVRGADRASNNLTFVTSLVGASSLLKDLAVNCPDAAVELECDATKMTWGEYRKCNP